MTATGPGIRVRELIYDIRDAILTCARKPILVSLIYRAEQTAKNVKQKKKLKSKNGYAQKKSKQSGEST